MKEILLLIAILIMVVMEGISHFREIELKVKYNCESLQQQNKVVM